MANFTARYRDSFIADFVNPFQKYVADLREDEHHVEAFYLSAQVVALAMRLGKLREVMSFVERQQRPGRYPDPIRIAAEVALKNRPSRSALAAETAIVGLSPYFEIEAPSYEEFHDPEKFKGLATRIFTSVDRPGRQVPRHVANGMLASTARLASLDNLELVQDQALGALYRYTATPIGSLVVPDYQAMEHVPLTLSRAADFARRFKDPHTAVALNLFGDSIKPELLINKVVQDSDPTYSTAKRFMQLGQVGTAAHLMDAAIDNTTTPMDSIDKILQDESKRSAAAPRTPLGPPPPRTLGAWISDATPEVGRPFTVDVMIGNETAGATASAGFTEPKWGNLKKLDLLIALSGLHCEVDPGERLVELPKIGNSERVTFKVTATVAEACTLSIRVFLHRQMLLLQSYSFVVKVSPVTARVAA